jgi:subtilisin family serine protease
LSIDLLAHEAHHSTARRRVIITSDPAHIAAIAARHQLQVVHLLENGAVLSASSGELTDLASDSDVPAISGDLPVRPWMTVSNAASAADQVRAGSSGLLGIGAIPAVNGSGIGVAVIDSGVNPHPALKNRIVANVSLVTDDPATSMHRPRDACRRHRRRQRHRRTGSRRSPGGIAQREHHQRQSWRRRSGLTSDVIAGIDWARIANRTILQHPFPIFARPPVANPPCSTPDQAVARAAQAGLIVVAAR